MAKRISYIPILLILAVVLAGCGGHSSRSANPGYTPGVRYWTVMVYMAADNDLEQYAIKDMNEMEAVGSTPEVTVVTQIDRTPGYDTSNGNWTTTRRYLVTRDWDNAIINSNLLEDMGELDMADPGTLADFVNWATMTYPAQNYLLVLWDHGRGWRTSRMSIMSTQRQVKAIHIDDTSGTEMSLDDLTLALEQSPHMDILLFDACLMGMLEVAYAVRDQASIMVASEENVPVTGQPYDRLLRRLTGNPAVSPYELSRVLVDEYMNHSTATYSGFFTLSAIDLASVGTLAAAADQLAAAGMATTTARSAIRSAQRDAQHYDHDKGYYTDYKDLYDFARLLSNSANDAAVRNAADGVISSVSSTVIHHRNSGGAMAGSHGLSIYLPNPGEMIYQYRQTSFAGDTRWADFIASY